MTVQVEDDAVVAHIGAKNILEHDTDSRLPGIFPTVGRGSPFAWCVSTRLVGFGAVMNVSPPRAWMRIMFPAPGFFVNDPKVTVHVNGWCAYAGGFRAGFDVGFPVVPGPLTMQTRIEVMGLGRDKTYTLVANEGYALEVALEYSRLWGNFGATPTVRLVPLAPMPPYR